MTAFLAFFAFCGIMTHYYFILIVIPITILYLIWLVLQKQFKMLLITIGTCFVVIVTVFQVHPSILWQVTGSHRGAQAFSNLNYRSGNLENLIEYLKIVRSSVINITDYTPMTILLLGCVVFVFAVVLCTVLFKKKKQPESSANPIWWFYISLILTGCFYTICIIRIAPYQEDRYLMALFPIIALLISVFLCMISERFRLPHIALPIATFVFLSIVGATSIWAGENYLYRQNDEIRALRESTSEIPAVCAVLADAGWERYTLIPELIQTKPDAQVFIKHYPDWESSPKDMNDVLTQAKQMSNTGQVMLFIAKEHFDSESVSAQMKKSGGFSKCSYFYSIRNWDVYIVS